MALAALSWASSATAAGTFAYRKVIMFHGGPTGVVGGTHASFPVLISLVNDADLQARVSSPSGYDIVFRGEDSVTCGGGQSTCTLDHEIERWDGATGTLVAWVRVPSLSATTVIYMYYGNKQVTSSTEAPRAVWDAGYVGVWHLGEQGAGNVNEYRDSSRYGNHGRGDPGAPPTIPPAIPARVPDGKIGNGQRFDNADGRYDFIDAGDDGTLRMTGNQITLEAWVRHNISLPMTRPYGILNLKGWNDGYVLSLTDCSFASIPCLSFGLPGKNSLLTTPETAPLGKTAWHHVVATYNGGAAAMTLFVDGGFQGSLTKTGNISPSAGGESLRIGQADQPEGQSWSGEFEGELDELRISRVARPAQWIATQFNNQNSPGAFYTVGAAEDAASYSPAILAVNYRSIGTSAANLSAGTASATSGAITVTVGTGLPANIGLGDQLDFTGAPAETLFILSRDSATQVTVQTPAASSHIDQTYTIKRAYNTLQGWSTSRQGDLVAGNRREVGVAYRDLPFVPFTAVTIGELGVTKTDPARYLKLTAAPGQRHRGSADTGVVLDNGTSPLPAIRILDDFATVEWFEIKGGIGAGAHGIELAAGINPANLATVVDNVIHDTGGDGVRLGDPDGIVDIRNNIIYGANYGIHFPVDMTADARVNVFNNTIYGCTATTGPSGVKSDVRQTSLRIDLRNNIAHSNLNGDFGVTRFFDRGYFCDPAPTSCTQIANGGNIGPNEYLADRDTNFELRFTNVASCLYLGSDSRFRGVNTAVKTAGMPSDPAPDLLWAYWNGSSWKSLETGPFYDGSWGFLYEGAVYWPNEPPDWVSDAAFTGWPNLYYVRACLQSGGYSTNPVEAYPVEAAITRLDIAIASQNNLAGDITGRPHSALFGGQSGKDKVLLPDLRFVSPTSPEDLHINAGSVAQDLAADLGRVFSGDIDGAVRAAPWDIGADEASEGSGPDLSIDTVRTSADPVVPGDPVRYRMTVTNITGGTLTSMTVTDTLLPEIRVPVYTPSMGSYDPASGIWTGLTLASGQSVTLDLLGTVDPWARGTLVNSARVEPPDGVIDPTPENNLDIVSDLLAPSADLALDKTGPGTADLGGLLTYTLTVTNNGPSAATGVGLTDPLPPPTEFSSATPSGACNFDVPTRTLTCGLGDIRSGGSATVTLTVRPMALGLLTNTASVAAPEDPAGNTSPPCQTTVLIPSDGVRFFTVTSRYEMNVLEWVNPTASYGSTEILVRTDRFPTGPGELGTTSLYNAGTAGAKDRLPHATGPGTNGQTFYYAAFVHLSPSGLSSGRLRTGRPLNPTAGPVKWAFSTGVFSLTPPTVGGAGIIATSNDMAVHAMARGADSPPGGEWPVGWLPFQVGGPVQSRSPVVPITVGSSNPVVFLSAQNGYVHALDGALGGAAPTPPWLAPHDMGAVVQAAPAGIFTAFHGTYDYLLVGTRDATVNADNRFVALNPLNGSQVGSSFDNGGGTNGIGMISGMASVVYGNPPRVYFASHAKAGGSTNTLWCLQLTGPPPTVFTGCTGWTPTPRALGDIESSPVLRRDRIYVGNDGTVYSIDAASGDSGLDRFFVHGDGQVKGFVFPDRNSDDIYFATDKLVWGFSDTLAGGMQVKFGGGISLGGQVRPSAALFVVLAGSRYVYVGGSDGRLYEINVTETTPIVKGVQLGDGKAVVGAPSFDWENNLVHVGTEAGIFYAVSVPLPPP